MNTAIVLLNTFNETRSLSNYYFSKLKDTDIDYVFEVNGVQLNSIKWIMAHLVWAEHLLLLEGMGADKIEVDWFSKVSFGTPMCPKEELPSIENILDTMKIVHETAQKLISGLSDSTLEEKNTIGMKFGPNENKKFMLIHAIRHEGNHAGQLGWLCKINGIKTI